MTLNGGAIGRPSVPQIITEGFSLEVAQHTKGSRREMDVKVAGFFLMLNSKGENVNARTSTALHRIEGRNMSRSVQHLVCRKVSSENHRTPGTHVGGEPCHSSSLLHKLFSHLKCLPPLFRYWGPPHSNTLFHLLFLSFFF